MTYYVSVDGGHAPKHQHGCKLEAVAEAKRLAQIPQNRDRAIRVLKEVGVYTPVKVESHEWKAAEE